MKKRVLILGILLVFSMAAGVYAECIDPDGGKNIYVDGGDACHTDGVITTPRFIYKASCPKNEFNQCYVKEYFCNSAGQTEYEFIKCPYGCLFGVCLSESDTCIDSDSQNTKIKGNVSIVDTTREDECPDSTTVKEYYCNDSYEPFPYYSSINIKCDYRCAMGICVEEGITCIDSDGGINGKKEGSIEYWSSGSEANEKQNDYCEIEGHLTSWRDKIDSCTGEEECFVVENYCKEDGKAGVKYIDCPNGCANSSCIGEIGDIRDTLDKCTENWGCSNWSTCVDGNKTRTCTDLNNCGTSSNKPEFSTNCTAEEENQNNGTPQDQTPSQQNITPTQECQKINSLNCPFGSRLQEEKDTQGCVTRYKCAYTLSNGTSIELQIMPEQASQKVMKEIGKGDYEARLREEVINGKLTVIYQIITIKKVRLFGLFPISARIISQVNAQNGEVINIKRPWWSFLATGI